MANLKDFHAKLLRNSPIRLENTKITIPSLGAIFDMDYIVYLEQLQSIILDFKDLEIDFGEKGGEGITDFQLFLFLIMQDKDLKNTFFEAIQLFTNETFIFEEGKYIASINEILDADGNFLNYEIGQVLTEEYWTELRSILRLAHWMPQIEKEEYGSERARLMMEKIKRNKKRVQEIKNKDGGGSSELYELIGGVCVNSKSYNLTNVWDLTYYQFFDQFYRMNIADSYYFSMQSLLAGADSKKVKLEHWSSPIKQDNN